MQFLTTEIFKDTSEIILSDEESFHLKKVLRVRVGGEIKLFDGKNQWKARVIGFNDGRAVLKPYEKIIAKEKKYRINLYIPFIEKKYFELVIKMGTELGVDKFIPFTSDYTQKHYEFDVGEKNLRMIEIIKSAVKQSERNSIPVVLCPLKFKDIFERDIIIANRTAINGKIYNATDIAAMNLNEFNILIGPEGGFSDDEVSFMVSHNCMTLMLSENILRAQTAAIAAVAVIVGAMNTI
jgi:16S rRNA (uracil1498-N3)-methyltransferase